MHCAALQSHQRQSYVKMHNITPSSSRKLHPNPSVPTYPHTKTKLHTKPQLFLLAKKNDVKKCLTEKKQNKIPKTIYFKTFFGGGRPSAHPRGGLKKGKIFHVKTAPKSSSVKAQEHKRVKLVDSKF